MKALHFAVSYRTNGTQKAPAQAHVQYITRAEDGAAAHVGYVTRTTQTPREDLVATGYGNLPAWAQDDPAAFFAASDRWERVNGRTATQITAALPRGLDQRALPATVDTFVQSQLGTQHAYVWGIHETRASDGGRYPHVHIAFSERRDTGQAQTPQDYFSQRVHTKERAFSQRDWPFAARQAWSDTLNVALEAAGSADRVSARSFTDQGLDWQAAQYVDRQTVQRHPEKLEQRVRTDDTPEAVTRRAQEWEARKQQLGITRDMERDGIVQKIGEASRAHVHNEQVQRSIRTRGLSGVSEAEASEFLARKREQAEAVSIARRNEQHYVAHPGQIRTPEHNVAVAKALQETPLTRSPQRNRMEEGKEEFYQGPVIGNVNSGIYHEPRQANFGDVHPKNHVHFRSAAEAEAQGYRRAQNDQYGEGSAEAMQEQARAQRPGSARTVARVAAVVTRARGGSGGLDDRDEGEDTGQVMRRRRTRQDDEQERGRTHAREW